MRDRRKAANLEEGLWLLILHPEIPTCADCQTWRYDVKTWKRSVRAGKEIRRQPGETLPCHQCPKSMKHNQPNPGAEMTLDSRRAYQYVLQCLADTTGMLPRDRVVIRNIALVQLVKERIEQLRGERMQGTLTMIRSLTGS